MASAFMKLSDGVVDVAPLNRFNWEQCLELEVENNQREFMPPVMFSIAQSKFENCTPCGIFYQGVLCGFAMFCIFQNTCWVNRILIDKKFQRQGIGGRALQLLIKHLDSRPDCREIRASVAAQNFAGERLFLSLGFMTIGENDGEMVMRHTGIR